MQVKAHLAEPPDIDAYQESERNTFLETQDRLDEASSPFPLFRFSVAVLGQLAIFLGLFAWLLPGMFHAELQHPLRIVLWTIGCGIPFSLFEYLYHRYLLHSSVLPFMSSMHRAHSLHHGLTYVKAPVTPKDPDKLVSVKSEYPIEKSHQEEAMMFPYYTTSIFLALFLAILALPLKWIFPSQPIVLAVLFGVVCMYSAYELWHAVLHLSFEEFWKPKLESKRIGKITQHIYGFHLMHHWRPTSNDAIVGFWGFAIWDHLFGTHRRPGRMPLKDAHVAYTDAALDKPRWPISMLDKMQAPLYKSSRAFERFLARVFLRRGTN